MIPTPSTIDVGVLVDDDVDPAQIALALMTVSRLVNLRLAQVEVDAAHQREGGVRRADHPHALAADAAHDRDVRVVAGGRQPQVGAGGCGRGAGAPLARGTGRSAVIGTRSA